MVSEPVAAISSRRRVISDCGSIVRSSSYGLGAHGGVEVAVLLAGLRVLFLGQQLAAFQGGQARLGHHVGFEIQHALDVAQGHVQHQADARRQRLQEPDVGDRRGQVDVAHALAAPPARVTSVPHFSQTTPRCFMRLYLPHRHS